MPMDNVDNPDEEIEFSADDAVALLQNSTSFDQFITDVMGDLENFNKEAREIAEKN